MEIEEQETAAIENQAEEVQAEDAQVDEAKPDEGIRAVVLAVLEELGKSGAQAELAEERKRRESLEHRVNELVAESQKARMAAEEAERGAAIRTELQKLGVSKIDLAYKAVKDDVYRAEDGRLMAQGGSGMREYLTRFVHENPELLPARMSGGSGAVPGQREFGRGGIDLEMIRPGMSAEERERVRQEIARVASQTLRGV